MSTNDHDDPMTTAQILTAESIAMGGTILESEWEGFALVADSHGARYAIAPDGSFLPVDHRGRVVDYANAIPGATPRDCGGGFWCLMIDRPEWRAHGLALMVSTDGGQIPGGWRGHGDGDSGDAEDAITIGPVSAPDNMDDYCPGWDDPIGDIGPGVFIAASAANAWGWPTPERVAEVVQDYGDGIADAIATGHGGATLADSLREIARNVALGESDLS